MRARVEVVVETELSSVRGEDGVVTEKPEKKTKREGGLGGGGYLVGDRWMNKKGGGEVKRESK